MQAPPGQQDPRSLLLHHLETGCVVPHFQPIVSIRRGATVGYEGLCRGLDPASGELIPPGRLFALAKREGLTVELDRLCRKVVLRGFQAAFGSDPGVFLSLNVESSIIDTVAGSNHLINSVLDAALRPCNVAVEIVESRVGNLDSLRNFTKKYKEYGFLIALDDVGAGHSNLGRIPLLKPDIIKIDRGLISHLDTEHYKQETVKSLIRLAHRLGAVIIAEGIEREPEAMRLLELGADMLQGFHFSPPAPAGEIDRYRLDETIARTSSTFRFLFRRRLEEQRSQNRILKALTQSILTELTYQDHNGFDTCLGATITLIPDLECAYVLDESGVQVSETICKYCLLSESRRIVFQPASRGADHSLKDYFLPVGPDTPYHVTEPYISFATGNLCRTVAATFTDREAKSRILCLDILVQSENAA